MWCGGDTGLMEAKEEEATTSTWLLVCRTGGEARVTDSTPPLMEGIEVVMVEVTSPSVASPPVALIPPSLNNTRKL